MRPTFYQLSSILFPGFLILLLASSLFLFVDRFPTWPPSFSSDDLYVVDHCRHLLKDYSSLVGTNLSAPCVFPDLVLLIPCYLMFSNMVLVFLVYSLLFDAALTATLTWIGTSAGLRFRAALITACSGVLLLAATHLGDPNYLTRGRLLFYPGGHMGAVLNGLLLIALVVRSFHKGFGPLSASAFAVLGAVAGVSDTLILVQTLLPIFLTLLVLCCCGLIPPRRFFIPALLLVPGVLASVGGHRLLARLGFVPITVTGMVNMSRFENALGNFFRDLPRMFERQSLLVVVMLAYWVIAVGFVWFYLRGRRAEPGRLDRISILALVLISLIGLATNVGAVTVSGVWVSSDQERYLLFPLCMPFLFFGLVLQGFSSGSMALVGRAWPWGVAILALWLNGAALSDFDSQRLGTPYTELTRAVDQLSRERGLHYGLASYFEAKPLSYFTKEQVRVKAATPAGDPLFLADNPYWFLSPDPTDLTIPTYRFVIVTREGFPRSESCIAPEKSQVVAAYGRPSETQVVGNFEILIYDRLEGHGFDQFLRSALAGKCRRRLAFTGPASPANLAQPKEMFTGTNHKKNVMVAPGAELEVTFAAPVTGQMLDLAADFRDAFEVTFYQGQQPLGKLHVLPVAMPATNFCWPGLQSRLLALPVSVRGQPWNRAILHPRSVADRSAVVGHFLIFGQAVALPGDRGPTDLPTSPAGLDKTE